METITQIAGWITIAAIVVALAASLVCLAFGAYRRAMDRFERAIIARTRHETGRDIGSCAHWFSENTETWTAVKLLGERLTNGYGTDVEQWREEWRRRIAAAKNG